MNTVSARRFRVSLFATVVALIGLALVGLTQIPPAPETPPGVAVPGPAPGGAVPSAAQSERHVLLLSIDGLRPDFYLDDAYRTPELRALLGAGSHARAVEGVFPSMTYPSHASMITGVRPGRHGIAFNRLFDPAATQTRWYEEASDLRATPLWEWARAAGLRTAAVSWPSTLGARIDALVPERDYYARSGPLDLLLRAATPGLFDRIGVTPSADMFKDVVRWDGFLTDTATAIIRRDRPHLLLLHLVQADLMQHQHGREHPAVTAAVARVDGHVGMLVRALRETGILERSTVVITGDHGFEDLERLVYPNVVLTQAGLRSCPGPGEGWLATAHIAGAGAAIFVSDDGAVDRSESVLRAAASPRSPGDRPGHRYTVLTRAELDALDAMPGAALALEAAPGYAFAGECSGGITKARRGGTHGFLPSRPNMATGFIAAGAGIRPGTVVDRIGLVDVAPTVARLLGLTPPAIDGRVLEEILQ
jgi:predicted AlkP superfamily pyrophosphatase or phosphodiesterase